MAEEGMARKMRIVEMRMGERSMVVADGSWEFFGRFPFYGVGRLVY